MQFLRTFFGIALLAVVWMLAGTAFAQDCSVVISEPGEEICDGYPGINFVPSTQVFDGFPAWCGGDYGVGIGYASWPYATFRSQPVDLRIGDQISISYAGWATGATGSIQVMASVSADNASFSPCGAAPGREFIGNSTSDTIECSSPIDATELYVRVETLGLSPALVYLRSLETSICAANNPPNCSTATADPAVLGPPDHRFAPVSIVGVTDPDGDAIEVVPTGVTQDEVVAEAGTGSGNTSPDAVLSPLAVRAERNGKPATPGDGRVYHVSFTAEDGRGGSCNGNVSVCVPHDTRPDGTCVDGGPLYDSIP